MLTLAEFERWRQFYLRWPFDDAHRFHRPAALVATLPPIGSNATSEDLQRVFWQRVAALAGQDEADALQRGGMGPKPGHQYTEADRETMRTFSITFAGR